MSGIEQNGCNASTNSTTSTTSTWSLPSTRVSSTLMPTASPSSSGPQSCYSVNPVPEDPWISQGTPSSSQRKDVAEHSTSITGFNGECCYDWHWKWQSPGSSALPTIPRENRSLEPMDPAIIDCFISTERKRTFQPSIFHEQREESLHAGGGIWKRPPQSYSCSPPEKFPTKSEQQLSSESTDSTEFNGLVDSLINEGNSISFQRSICFDDLGSSASGERTQQSLQSGESSISLQQSCDFEELGSHTAGYQRQRSPENSENSSSLQRSLCCEELGPSAVGERSQQSSQNRESSILRQQGRGFEVLGSSTTGYRRQQSSENSNPLQRSHGFEELGSSANGYKGQRFPHNRENASSLQRSRGFEDTAQYGRQQSPPNSDSSISLQQKGDFEELGSSTAGDRRQQWPQSKFPTWLKQPTKFPNGSSMLSSNFEQTIDEVSEFSWIGPMKSKFSKTPRFCRKVFIGGIPHDLTQADVMFTYRNLGPIQIEWPLASRLQQFPHFGNKANSGGYMFIVFKNNETVNFFLEHVCNGKFGSWHTRLSSRSVQDKVVEVIPWDVTNNLYELTGPVGSAAAFGNLFTVFIGGVHGQITAENLFLIMNKMFDGVVSAGMDVDKNGYPIGTAHVSFYRKESYLNALKTHFVNVKILNRKIQIEPFLEKDIICSVCNVRPGPFFCRNFSCLKYYCIFCFRDYHMNLGVDLKESLLSHEPMLKVKGAMQRQISTAMISSIMLETTLPLKELQ